LSQPIETVRVPVSSRPMVCGVVGGVQAWATSSSVIPRARRTSRIRVIMIPSTNQNGFSLSYRFADVASPRRIEERRIFLAKHRNGRLIAERPLDTEDAPKLQGVRKRRPARSVTVNLAESPLGWLRSRGLVTQRQFDAGERLRLDWERAQLAPRVTMSWNAAPMSRSRRSSSVAIDPSGTQIDAKRRFREAVDTAVPGLADILWRVVCSGEGMREAESALGWPARAGKLVLLLALDRVADYYRIR